jgi:hypothetical protein
VSTCARAELFEKIITAKTINTLKCKNLLIGGRYGFQT